MIEFEQKNDKHTHTNSWTRIPIFSTKFPPFCRLLQKKKVKTEPCIVHSVQTCKRVEYIRIESVSYLCFFVFACSFTIGLKCPLADDKNTDVVYKTTLTTLATTTTTTNNVNQKRDT